jgi:hypothetical protein
MPNRQQPQEGPSSARGATVDGQVGSAGTSHPQDSKAVLRHETHKGKV